jgi:hypothetical protein
MAWQRRPPSQTWRTFLDNYVESLVSVDFFVVPTIRFQTLCILGAGPQSPAHSTLRRHRTPAARSPSWGQRSSLLVAGSRPDFWSRICGAGQGHGSQASAVYTSLTLTARLRRTANRLDSPRVLGRKIVSNTPVGALRHGQILSHENGSPVAADLHSPLSNSL